MDALAMVCNIFGQYLMSTAYMEQWYFWLGVNIFSIIMWAQTLKGASDSYAIIYIIKYSFYMVNALNGLRIWLRLSKKAELEK
jgi:nicotinamide mononucleotide transporter